MSDNPFFIVSAPRSGSTMLRLILDANPNLAVPPPDWLFDLVYPYLYSYGDLGKPANLHALAEDMLATPTVSKWPIKPSADELVKASTSSDFGSLYGALHALYAKSESKTRWGEKTPRNSFWMDEIRKLYPCAQFIHIVRDGRDQAIDISDSLLWPYSVYSGAHLWQRYVLAVRDCAREMPAGAFIEIRYEDLCAAPEATVRKLCEFLREPFDARMLAPHETRSARAWSEHPLHAKTARPISKDYCGMYRRRLPAADVAALEALIGPTLQLFNYPLTATPQPVAARLAARMLESDTVTNPENVAYRHWHEVRRKQRREQGVWSDEQRDSKLWGMN